MIIAIICESETAAQKHIDALQAELRQSNLSQVPMRTIAASGQHNYALSGLMRQTTVGKPITFVGPSQLKANNRKKMADQHFLSEEVVVIVTSLPEQETLDAARHSNYWSNPKYGQRNRVLVLEADAPETDAAIIATMYRLPLRFKLKLRGLPEGTISRVEREVPSLRPQAFGALIKTLGTEAPRT